MAAHEEAPEESCYRHILEAERELRKSRQQSTSTWAAVCASRAAVHMDLARWYDHMAFMAGVDPE